MKIVKILAIGFIIRLVITVLFSNISNFDTDSYQLIGNLTLHGINIYPYPAVTNHPYLPFFLYWEALALYLSKIISPILFLKLLFTLFDLGNIYLTYLLTNKNMRTALLYAVNPITILITNFHGQFDVVPVFFILSAIYYLKLKRELLSLSLLSLAILIKTWPVLFIIPFLKYLKKPQLIIIIFIIPLFSVIFYSLVFASNVFPILETVRSYRGVYESWGIGKYAITLLFDGQPDMKILIRRVFFITFIAYSIFRKDKSIIFEIMQNMLFFFCLTPTFGIQWLAWITPFIIIVKPKSWKMLLSAITIFLMANYITWLNITVTLQFTTLITFVCWLSFIYIFMININTTHRKLYI